MRVYAMITELASRARYVKFGMAADHRRRMMEVQCGCPLRIERVLWMECASEDAAIAIEAALHLEHQDSHASGEWFKWAAGSKAEPEATEAMTLIGEREMGGAHVTAEDVPRQRNRKAITLGRYRNASSRARASMPVVGDADLALVPVVVKRSKLLKNKC